MGLDRELLHVKKPHLNWDNVIFFTLQQNLFKSDYPTNLLFCEIFRFTTS